VAPTILGTSRKHKIIKLEAWINIWIKNLEFLLQLTNR
jgi:hypothetical protein